MSNYIFGVVAGACTAEILLELLPLSGNGAVKKYVKYIFSLVLALCIASPVIGMAKEGALGKFEIDFSKENPVKESIGYVYYEEGISYKCGESGIPDFANKISTDIFIEQCFFEISENTKNAISERLDIEKSKIKLGISFDARDMGNIKIIRGFVGIDGANKYVKSDALSYLKELLQTEVGGLE